MKGLIRDVFDALFKIKVDDLKGWEDTHLTDTMCERMCLVYTWCGYDSAFLFVIDHCGVLKRENPELLFEKFLWRHHKIKVVIRKFPHY